MIYPTAMKFFRTLIVSIIVFSFTPSAFAGFSDVLASNDGISYLELTGAIDSGEEFRTDDPLLKSELYAILFRVLGEDVNNVQVSQHYLDVPEDSWFGPYSELALRYGLEDNRDENFEPGKEMNKIETLSILLDAYGVGIPYIPNSQRTKLFQDVSKSHHYYMELNTAIDNGLLEEDSNGSYYPYATLTRGEFADMIYKFDQWDIDLSYSDEADFYKSDIFANVWNNILDDFYLETGTYIDADILFQSAVKSMVQSLGDNYSTYFTPDEAEIFSEALTGQFTGIGAHILEDTENGSLIITGFVEGSPAANQLQVGDEITKVDGVSIGGMDIDSIISRIKGDAGTSVLLTIERNGKEYTYEIVREELEVSLIDSKILYSDTNPPVFILALLKCAVFSSGKFISHLIFNKYKNCY